MILSKKKQKTMLYFQNLDNLVKNSIAQTNCDEVHIISGYVGAEMVLELVKTNQDIKFKIIYGMYSSDNISKPLHEKLNEVDKNYQNVEIYYAVTPVHSKIYYFYNSKKKQYLSVFIGSANCTINGLKVDYKETLNDIEPINEYYNYIDYVLSNSIRCNSSAVIIKKVKKYRNKKIPNQPLAASGICRATLLDNTGKVPIASGLNWGASPNGHVRPGDAYIAIRKSYLDMFPSLFPTKKYINTTNPTSIGKSSRQNDEVEFIWDDNTSMRGLFEGTQQNGGLPFPNKICSSINKQELGIYIRKRLGITNLQQVITVKDLKRYGRTHIDISLIAPGIYYMDFSV